MTRQRTVAASLAALLLLTLPAGAGAAELAAAKVELAYGLRALHHSELDEAAARLRHAVELDPESGDAHYWLGRLHLERGEGEEAAAELQAALAARRPPRVPREAVRQELASARRLAPGEAAAMAPVELSPRLATGVETPRWEARLGVAAGSDSNPLLIPDGAVTVVDGTPRVGPISDDTVGLDLRGEVHPFTDRHGWTLGLAGEGERASFSDLSVLDATVLRGTVQLAWGSDPVGYLAGPLGFTRVPFGDGRTALLLQAGVRRESLGGDPFRRFAGLGLALFLRQAAATTTQLEASWADRQVTANDAATGDEWSVRASQFFYLGRRDRHLRLAVERGRRSAGPAFAADRRELRLEAALPLSQRWAVQLAASERRLDFDDLESIPASVRPLADRPRRDTRRRLVGVLVFAPTRQLRLVARAGHTSRDADLGAADPFLDLDYGRDTLSLGLTWLPAGGGR